MGNARHRYANALLTAALALCWTNPASAQDATRLQSRYAAQREQFAQSPFNRPLLLQSTQSANDLSGAVQAVVDRPFSAVGPALASAAHWCDVLMLHLNVKACRLRQGVDGAPTLATIVGRKVEQPGGDGYPVELKYALQAERANYLRVQMSADEGPLGTRDYRIALEAAPVDGGRRTYLQLAYSYAYGTVARLAMEGYLSTLGRGKVGFSVVGKNANGEPVHVDGVRGVIERNTMRYFLAIDAYLAALDAPPAQQPERRLNGWFAATEKNALQLHEMSRDEYLTMKHHELQRSQLGFAPP